MNFNDYEAQHCGGMAAKSGFGRLFKEREGLYDQARIIRSGRDIASDVPAGIFGLLPVAFIKTF